MESRSKQEIDINQSQMELIDIWHFGLSDLLQRKGVNEVYNEIEEFFYSTFRNIGTPTGNNQAKSLNRNIQGGQKKTETPPVEGGETQKQFLLSSLTPNKPRILESYYNCFNNSSYNPGNEDDLKLINLNTYKDSFGQFYPSC